MLARHPKNGVNSTGSRLFFVCFYGIQHLKNRRIRVDVAGHQQQQQGKPFKLESQVQGLGFGHSPSYSAYKCSRQCFIGPVCHTTLLFWFHSIVCSLDLYVTQPYCFGSILLFVHWTCMSHNPIVLVPFYCLFIGPVCHTALLFWFHSIVCSLDLYVTQPYCFGSILLFVHCSPVDLSAKPASHFKSLWCPKCSCWPVYLRESSW